MCAKKKNDGNITNRAIKVPIYPTEEQIVMFAKTFGCCRFYWNKALEDEKATYEETGKFNVPDPALYKKEYTFLAEVDSLALCNTQINMKQAFKSFFKEPDRVGYPKFKKKHDKQSYTTNCQYNSKNPTIEVFEKAIKLPKIGKVKANIYRKPGGDNWVLKSATVSKTKSGKYFCSLLYEFPTPPVEEILPTEDRTIGLDYSSPNFFVDDHGNMPEEVHWFRKSEEHLARLQRKLAHKTKGSKNYYKTLRQVQELHEHIANQRKDYTHKLSTAIANAYDMVCVEDIDLQTMARTLNFGKSTNDNGFGMFREQLKYKLAARGKQYTVIDKWFPSSKMCSYCGYIYKDLTLDIREWDCPVCKRHLPRDLNAGRNIKYEGLRSFYETRKITFSPKAKTAVFAASPKNEEAMDNA